MGPKSASFVLAASCHRKKPKKKALRDLSATEALAALKPECVIDLGNGTLNDRVARGTRRAVFRKPR